MITPNMLTGSRIVIALIIPFVLLIDRTVTKDLIALALFAIASITDWFDGYLARKHALISGLGKVLDPIADKILTLGMFGIFAYIGLYHWILVVFIFIREILVTTIRFVYLKRGKVIPAESAGKIKMCVQIVSLSVSFLYLLKVDSGSPENLSIWNGVNLTCIGLANILTITSGLSFLKHLPRKG